MTEISSAGIGVGGEPAALVYPVHPSLIPLGEAHAGRYRLRFARGPEDLDQILRLRFEVFNLELGEGLDSSFATGRDEDRFDQTCHHLLVELEDGSIIGTYRMQTLVMAQEGCGFYSAGEYDLGALPRMVQEQSMELGRACIHHEHRNKQVLFLLWRGLALYVQSTRNRYFFGCSSLTSTNPEDGVRLYRQLRAANQVHPEISVQPLPAFRCTEDEAQLQLPPPPPEQEVHIPRLFRTYLRYGAKIIGAPALDREFGTVDFLVLLDVAELSEKSRALFF